MIKKLNTLFIILFLSICNTHAQNANLISKANSGDANAQYSLALKYYNGSSDFKQNHSEAFVWALKAAKQGHKEAQDLVGFCYWSGVGIEKDLSQAVEWYTLSANQGYTNAMKNLGVCYANGQGVTKDLSKSFQWYLKAAEGGDTGAMYSVAMRYRNGKGVASNALKAKEWIEKASENGNPDAQYELAKMLLKGTSEIPADTVNACFWLFYSAKGGNDFVHKADERNSKAKAMLEKIANDNTSNWIHYAKYYIGQYYYLVENDYNKAEEYLYNAYRFGCKEASAELGWLYTADLEGGSIRTNTAFDNSFGDSDEAKRFRQREHRFPNDNSIYWFNVALKDGVGNDNGMLYWHLCNLYVQNNDFDKAASSLENFLSEGHYFNGPLEDYLRLADLYYLSNSNPESAFRIYKERYDATKNKDTNSEYYDETWYSWMACGLGKCYYSGFGVPQNATKAFLLFKEAVAADNDPEAMYLISRCYRLGRGTTQNLKLADEWLAKSKQFKDPSALRVSSALKK